MLRSVAEIVGYRLQATDGDIGRCKDLLFDDAQWTVRYVVAETGGWLSGRKTLISPISIERPDWGSRRIVTRLDRKQIESAPELDADAPVSRQYERRYHAYFRWPRYWGGAGIWAADAYPQPLFDDEGRVAVEEADEDSGDPHLRSFEEVKGYRISARDGSIGQVDDLIMDDASWAIRYLVVDTRRWLPGKKVLVSPLWVTAVHWSEQDVHVDLDRDQIKDSPKYDPTAPVNRDYEVRLFDFYGRPHYW